MNTATNNVTATVNEGNYPTGVTIGPFIDSNMTDQRTMATSNPTEDMEVEKTNLSSSEEKNAAELNNSNNNCNNDNNSGSDNGSSSGRNESSNNNSTPGFGLLGSLGCLYTGWKLRKKQ